MDLPTLATPQQGLMTKTVQGIVPSQAPRVSKQVEASLEEGVIFSKNSSFYFFYGI